MDFNYVQHLRYKLQKRFRKVNAAGFPSFHFALCRFWEFLNNSDHFVPLLEQLSLLLPATKADAEKVLAGEPLFGMNEDEEAALAYWVVRLCVESGHDRIEMNISSRYSPGRNADLELFKDTFVEPIYEYLDEHLDDERSILAMLRRYKHKCEWFRRAELRTIYEDELKRAEQEGGHSQGEKKLALHLYEYLHDQGLVFSIEPTSASGEADLIGAQESDEPLIADVKIFDPGKNKNKGYIVSAFQQVYRYTVDYNEPFGYLVIFKTCEADLGISSSRQEQSTSFIVYNGKTIFFVIIDLFEYAKPASQRGKLKSYIITEKEFVTEHVESEEPEGEAPVPPRPDGP